MFDFVRWTLVMECNARVHIHGIKKELTNRVGVVRALDDLKDVVRAEALRAKKVIPRIRGSVGFEKPDLFPHEAVRIRRAVVTHVFVPGVSDVIRAALGVDDAVVGFWVMQDKIVAEASK